MKVSREKIKNAFKKVWESRPKISHETSLTVSSLLIIFIIAFVVRLLPIRWGMSLSEFDPFFQYRFTEHILDSGFLSWRPWYDLKRWYPISINIDITEKAYPGLPLTAATLYTIISFLGISIPLKDFCIIFPAVFGAITCIALYFLGKEIAGKNVGLLSALVLALSPTHITRTSLGFFDDETVGLLAIIILFTFYLRAIDDEKPVGHSLLYGVLSGLALGYICASWGASYYPIGLITLFSFVLLLLRKFNERLLLTYSLVFGIGIFIAIHVPKLGLDYLTTWPILVVAGTFLLLCLNEIIRRTKTTKWKVIYFITFMALIAASFAGLYFLGYMKGIAGKFISVINPAAREGSAIVMSVQEHRMTSWSTLYYEYGIILVFFIVGFFFAAGNLTKKNVFLILFGVTTLYFSSSMVRLLVLSTPAVGILAGMGLIGVLRPFITLIKGHRMFPRRKGFEGIIGKEFGALPIFLCFILLVGNFAFPFPRVYSHAYTPTTLLAGSMPIRPVEPVTEWMDALTWIRTTLPEDAVIFSWWDYGYWITVEGNRTSLADNATFNTTHIAIIGRVFVENETNALKILETIRRGDSPPPGYILVFTTVVMSADYNYSYANWGDMGKWTWMLRIAESNKRVQDAYGPITLSDYINETTNQPIPNSKFYDSLIYKLMEHARYYVVNELYKMNAPLTDPAQNSTFFNEHFKLIYPNETHRPKYESYGGVAPIIAIYKVEY
ncbi:hypothetical protein DRO54_02120 [Candidatus Bathyarchaeota archaeon]|nr:MAG: hypothetical protein DRO54_02120 [Candidatus Bathyarchaeota archaeon]